jgi:hypothetical protein
MREGVAEKTLSELKKLLVLESTYFFFKDENGFLKVICQVFNYQLGVYAWPSTYLVWTRDDLL